MNYEFKNYGYEIKSLKSIPDNFFEYKDKQWVPINLYTEVICESNDKIEKALSNLTKKYKDQYNKIFEIKNKMSKSVKDFENLAKDNKKEN